MIRVNLALSGAIVVSAFTLVNSQYESRRLYAAADRAKAHASELETERESLLAQRRVESAPGRIQAIASGKLAMRAPDPATTLYLSSSGSQDAP